MNTIIGVGVVAVNISILYLHQSTRTISSCDVGPGKDGLENVVENDRLDEVVENNGKDEDNGTIDEDNGTCKDDTDDGIGNVYEYRRWYLPLVYENRPQRLYLLDYDYYARYLFPMEERPRHLQYLFDHDPAVEKYLSAKGLSTRPISAQPVQTGTVPPRSHPGLYPPQPST